MCKMKYPVHVKGRQKLFPSSLTLKWDAFLDSCGDAI